MTIKPITSIIKTKNKIMKKIFLVAKVYEMEPATLMSVQQEIQNDLDRFTNGRRVVLSITNPAENELEFTFNRTSSLNLVEDGMINSVDALAMTGDGLDNFRMPEPLPSAPFGSYFNTFIGIDDFIDCYKKSARKLGASRMKNINLETTPEYVKLKLTY